MRSRQRLVCTRNDVCHANLQSAHVYRNDRKLVRREENEVLAVDSAVVTRLACHARCLLGIDRPGKRSKPVYDTPLGDRDR